jgi:NAD(P)-dependent dehydrogenase (short-subunit alcohol dehydrogenase family)
VDLKLTGKIALVTGSTAGIGLAIAKSLACEGAHVYVNGRTQERVDAAMAAIRSHAAAAKVDGIAADFSGSAGTMAPKRHISAAGLARIRAATKARWAKWRWQKGV